MSFYQLTVNKKNSLRGVIFDKGHTNTKYSRGMIFLRGCHVLLNDTPVCSNSTFVSSLTGNTKHFVKFWVKARVSPYDYCLTDQIIAVILCFGMHVRTSSFNLIKI